eukprot:Platyproteum_vivax@DN3818_c0_g1_i1.p1
MIQCCMRIFQYRKRTKVVLCGPSQAGKTSLILKLKLAEFVSTVPTYGVNTEDFEYGRSSLRVFDCSSKDPIYPGWRSHIHEADAVVYVLDSTDKKKLLDAKDDLIQLLFEERLVSKNINVLIFANKQDLFSAASLQTVSEILDLPRDVMSRCCLIGSSAITGVGLHDGMDWVLKTSCNSQDLWGWRNGARTQADKGEGVSMVALSNRTSLLNTC